MPNTNYIFAAVFNAVYIKSCGNHVGRRKHLVFIRWITEAESTYSICVQDIY